ncbi:MAG: type II/IV secretion system protein [Deltaproteobacteria bacterium]|nr:type II/IV secretion system protein [Deltaproteobacteria bacterium]
MAGIIELMVERGLLSAAELKKIKPSGREREALHRLAIRTGLVSEEDFLALVAQELKLGQISELPVDYDSSPFTDISPLFLEEHRCFPLGGTEALAVIVNDPYDHLVLETFRQLFPGRRIDLLLAREEKISTWIRRHFLAVADSVVSAEAKELAGLARVEMGDDVDHLRDLASEAPIIKLVNQFLTKAVEEGASDIHIEPQAENLQVRFRVDGVLREHAMPPKHIQSSIISRVKIMARMDIAERRLPQDGRIRIKISGKDIDLRVSCLPTVYGESVVMRILDRNSISFSLGTLGFPDTELRLFEEMIHLPYGIILVTGPTGSGKTTTLYAALNTINAIDKKIITIEDPVEYELNGINQVQVNSKAGLNFSSGLRSIVRQDPDVILIGEIRDRETADIAIQSALTGHLVFSTLHTNDAAGAVTRMVEIGVEGYLLSSSLVGIMAQRLVRVLCPVCKEAFVPEPALVKRLQLPFTASPEAPIYRPKGCKECSFSGYRGRVGIFELLPVTDAVRGLILKSQSSLLLREHAVKNGMTLLREDGWAKVRAGITSLEEVVRVSGA